MNTEQLLLDAIFSNPADDTVRLVYADWLDEQPQEGKCTWCKGTGSGGWEAIWDKNFLSCYSVERECNHCFGTAIAPDDTKAKRAAAIRWFIANPDYHQSVPITEFVPSLTEFKFSGEVCGVWHRGFGSEVRMRCADFLKHAGEAFANQPVTRVELVDRVPSEYEHHSGKITLDWWNLYEEGESEMDAIPYQILMFLTGSLRCSEKSYNLASDWHEYASVSDAQDALSEACCIYGREQAKKWREANRG